MNQKGCVLWFTGLSGSGKSTVAYTLEHALFQKGKIAQVLDGDNIRHGLNSNVDFSPEGREENIRRIGEVSKLFADSGMITLVSFISPYRADRDRVRERVRQRAEAAEDVLVLLGARRDQRGEAKGEGSCPLRCHPSDPRNRGRGAPAERAPNPSDRVNRSAPGALPGSPSPRRIPP